MSLNKLTDYWGSHRYGGDRTVFILGNGPSLNDYDLSPLKYCWTISMNRGYHKFVGDYYVTLMDTFYLSEVMNKPYETTFVVGSHIEVPQDIRHSFVSNLIFVPRLTKYDDPPIDPFDLTQGWKVTHTGVFALCLAEYMGFANAVLLGYDGEGRHFMPRVQADDWPKELKIRREMEAYMDLPERKLQVYNCNTKNRYRHKYLSYEEALEL